MAAVRYLVRANLRRRARDAVVLALLCAVVVATVFTALAGSRRSRTAFDRYLARINVSDAAAFGDAAAVDAVAASPLVTDAQRAELLAMQPEAADPSEFFPMAAPVGDPIGSPLFVAPVVAGRRADPDQPLEVEMGERTARRLHVGVGGHVRFLTSTQANVDAGGGRTDAPPDGPAVDLEVVGIVRDPGDIGGREGDLSVTFLTPAFTEQFEGRIGALAHTTLFRTRSADDIDDLTSEAQALGDVEIDRSISAQAARASVDPTMAALAGGLRAFALAAALAGAVALAQVASRAMQRAGAERDALEAVGVTAAGRRLALAVPSAGALV